VSDGKGYSGKGDNEREHLYRSSSVASLSQANVVGRVVVPTTVDNIIAAISPDFIIHSYSRIVTKQINWKSARSMGWQVSEDERTSVFVAADVRGYE
jgi:hypothetical protein